MALTAAELAAIFETLSDEEYAAVVAAFCERLKAEAGVAYGLLGPATNEELGQ